MSSTQHSTACTAQHRRQLQRQKRHNSAAAGPGPRHLTAGRRPAQPCRRSTPSCADWRCPGGRKPAGAHGNGAAAAAAGVTHDAAGAGLASADHTMSCLPVGALVPEWFADSCLLALQPANLPLPARNQLTRGEGSLWPCQTKQIKATQWVTWSAESAAPRAPRVGADSSVLQSMRTTLPWHRAACGAAWDRRRGCAGKSEAPERHGLRAQRRRSA